MDRNRSRRATASPLALTQANRHKEAADVLEELGARSPDAPNDLYFRLGEIYERRLNDPVKAKRGVRESAGGFAALQRRAEEAESQIGQRANKRTGSQGLLISMSPVTTSSEMTGSPLPSVASAHRGPHVSRRVRGMSEVT